MSGCERLWPATWLRSESCPKRAELLSMSFAGMVLLSACGSTPTPSSPGTMSSGGSGGAVAEAGAGGSGGAVGTGFVRAQGTGFVDVDGTRVHFSGVGLSNDAWGRYVWPESQALQDAGKDPLIRPTEFYPWSLTDVDFELLDELPINVVRYNFAHEIFAADNPKLGGNLQRLEDDILRLGSLGIRTIVCLNTPIGLDGQSDGVERDKPPSEREESFIEDDAYYAATLTLWKTLAARLAQRPEVLGYELVNEPRVPSPSEGGEERYRERLQGLVDGIREVDRNHVVFIPEWNSREADDANQTVVWGQGLVKLEDDNLAYVLHHYGPYEFTTEGTRAEYDVAALRQEVERRTQWRDTVGHAPLFATEYGVNRRQPMERRLQWMRDVHALFVELDISSTWFDYKAEVSAYVQPASLFGIYGQYTREAEQVNLDAPMAPWANADVASKADSNAFAAWYSEYFAGHTAKDVLLMDSQPVVDELARYRRLLDGPDSSAAR